jgi:hypothetical protein
MAKSARKKKTTTKAKLVTAAETAGRSLGRAVAVVERAIGRARAQKRPTPRKRATGKKR